MKRTMTLILLCAMVCASSLAMAAGMTIRTFTPFADMDFAAQAYNDLIGEWEQETGNFVEDYSGAMDELWLAQLAEMAGQTDIVILPVGSGLTETELVTAAELAATAPQLGARVLPAFAEADGSVLLTPVRLNWESLYVNTAVLEENGVAVPETLEDLATVCAALSAKGVLPIANALGDWAEIVLDCLALCGAQDAPYGGEASLAGAQDALTMLTAVGAFGSDTAMTDDEAMDAFLAGEAAMRFDSDFLAYEMSSEMAAVVKVIALPARGGAQSGLVVGTPSIGLAITRSCFADEARREAAISLCEKLLGESALVSPVGGMLGESIMQITRGAQDCAGLLYDANPEGFDRWSEQVIQAIQK